MIKHVILASATVALLLASPAHAHHCDADVAEVEALLTVPATDEPSLLDTAELLLDQAIGLCAQEEQEIAEAAADSPLLEPDYVTLGLAYLISAKAQINGN